MKKKSFKLILAMLVVVLVVVLTACAAKDTASDPSNPDEPVIATLVGGSPNGTWFMVSTGVSECVNRSYPGSVVTIVTGSGLGNITRINAGEVDTGLAYNIMLNTAAKGEKPFEEKLTNLSTIAKLFPSYLQIVVKKDLGVTSLDEIIKNKMKVRLSIDQPGSNASQTFLRLIAAYGVTEKDFEDWGGQLVQKSMEESSTMLSDGLIDGFAIGTLYPVSAIQEAAVNKDLVLLQISSEVRDTMIETYGYQAAVIPADAYTFTVQETPTIAGNTVLAIPTDASDELAYKLTKSLVENLDYFRQIHVMLADLTPETMAKDTGAPLHPGAVKYYEEVGAL